MKKPIYFYIDHPTCRRNNKKAEELADSLSLYTDLIITPEAATRLAEKVEEKVNELNEKYKRCKPFSLQCPALIVDDPIANWITVSDGTDNPVVHIQLHPIYTIIDSTTLKS